ncbi:MAG: hypothetical protein HN729_11175 [Candidatus Marinimicrobia bacterium]|jgi:L-alanine-DL-glutamate epimerase-like enolase superfamily enzyme|nr:hypothetical protein [Candidatus Neomarinimicrobiota bacterium]MBT3632726.1 hypothetical protein [Candidatus Neomarinimicrobiota bacterium]MBT3681836.1 hypothetical protein [Candidatus Neomarinimicrobiota bacterium]MBT3760531.1 hypothetical protein [Candidatus Neomarinimicrobiota bacterium]MBT3896677.1 hypothetical protein [Candidatus Neomarinimicrobiota bacterium]
MTDLFYYQICKLPVKVESVSFETLEQTTSNGWTRTTTIVNLHGGGHVGRGEDVNYSNEEQQEFVCMVPPRIIGNFPGFDSYSRYLDSLDNHLFPSPPDQLAARLYRRWAFESAGLDLALRQAKTSLGEVLLRNLNPLRYVVSTGLGSPPSVQPLNDKLAMDNTLDFKIDYSAEFTDMLLEELKSYNISCVDFKGHYHGTFSGPPVNTIDYQNIALAFPDAILEDPGFAGLDVLSSLNNRLSWDFPVHSVADILLLPETGWLNIKPSRFGFLSELLRAIELALSRGISLYGGGQFEIGIGRSQAQEIASLFYSDGPNDLAPSEFNEPDLSSKLQKSPLILPNTSGFGF